MSIGEEHRKENCPRELRSAERAAQDREATADFRQRCLRVRTAVIDWELPPSDWEGVTLAPSIELAPSDWMVSLVHRSSAAVQLRLVRLKLVQRQSSPASRALPPPSTLLAIAPRPSSKRHAAAGVGRRKPVQSTRGRGRVAVEVVETSSSPLNFRGLT